VVYIWRFQSAIEFQSVNQTIPSACVPQKMSCVMRPANTARTLREHCANTARTQREPHALRTRRGKMRKMSRIERLGWGSWQPSPNFVRKLGNMDIFCCKTHKPTGCDFSGYNPAVGLVGRPVQNWPFLRGDFPAEVSFYWRAFQSVTEFFQALKHVE
jgi:hypothetical protein